MSTLLPSVQTRPITLSVSANQAFTIEHGLGRPVAGWQIVDIDKPARVWRSGENGSDRLILTCDQSCNLVVVLL
ncbi:hypothetical protein [Endozoicomonas sp. 2B-B]